MRFHAVILGILAMSTAAVLGLAARRAFLFADVRVLTTELRTTERLQAMPLSAEQREYKALRNSRDMFVATAEAKRWRRFGVLLIFAQALPVALLACTVSLLRFQSRTRGIVEHHAGG